MARVARNLKARTAEDTTDAASVDALRYVAEDTTDAGGDSSGCDTLAHHFFPPIQQTESAPVQTADGALDCYESLLERKQDEPWGFLWNVRAHTRKSLIIAGISADSPAGRWNARQQELQIAPIARGDILVDANGATERSAIQRVLASTNVVLLRFVRSEVSPMLPRRKTAGTTAPESAVAGGSPKKYACRVRNTFIHITGGDESQEERLTQSEPVPDPVRIQAVSSAAPCKRSSPVTDAAKAPVCPELDTASDSEIDTLRHRHQRGPAADDDTDKSDARPSSVPATPAMFPSTPATCPPDMDCHATDSEVDMLRPQRKAIITDGCHAEKADTPTLLFPPTPAMFPPTPATSLPRADCQVGILGVEDGSPAISSTSLPESHHRLLGRRAMISGLTQSPQFNGQCCN
jgi:hypothetical protein